MWGLLVSQARGHGRDAPPTIVVGESNAGERQGEQVAPLALAAIRWGWPGCPGRSAWLAHGSGTTDLEGKVGEALTGS